MFGQSVGNSRRHVIALATVVSLTACGTSASRTPLESMEPTGANDAEQHNEMRARPNIEEITQRYDEITATIRQRIVADLGLRPWITNDKLGTSGCRDYPAVDQALKEARTLPGWYSEGNISDAKWPDAVRIANEIVEGYGFGDMTIVVDQPGNHEISLRSRNVITYFSGGLMV